MKKLQKTKLLKWLIIYFISFTLGYNLVNFKTIYLLYIGYFCYGFLVLSFIGSFIVLVYTLIKEYLKK